MKILWFTLLCLLPIIGIAQQPTDSSNEGRFYKNVIRYNLSGAIVFGIDKYIVFGYERVVSPHQSFSINVGRASLPKLITISTDSFDLEKDQKRSGFNISADYRFYLARENKFRIPHGVYIGPYYSYNHFTGENHWTYKRGGANSNIGTNTDFDVHTFGFELGYQFVLWKRLTLDMLMVGPGVGFYNYKAKFDSNIDAATREQLFQGLQQLLTQKFPGMNYVFSDKEFSADGTMKTSAIGHRCILHVGFLF